MEIDELDALIAKRAARNPAIPAMIEAERRKRASERERRQRLGLPADGTVGLVRVSSGVPIRRLATGARRHKRPVMLRPA